MRRNLEAIEELMRELKKESKESLILVEGKKDKKALEKFGIKNVIELSGKPLFKLTEFEKEVIILIDNDEEGDKILRELLQGFQLNKVKYNLRFRRKLGKLGIRKIEELSRARR